MPERYLFDTDVIIEYLRGSNPAIEFLEGLDGQLLLSAISVAVLYTGIRGSKEQKALEQFLLAFEVLPVDDKVARTGGSFRREFGPSHGTGLADALIAATSHLHGATFVTFNARHYPMLENLRIPYKRS